MARCPPRQRAFLHLLNHVLTGVAFILSVPYTWVDVFAERPYTGNQLCVFRPASPLDDHLMQWMARETNHVESAFLEPPTGPHADWRVRILWTSRAGAAEIPFAGHPLLGTAAVLLPAGGTVRLETGVGVVPITVVPEAEGVWSAEMVQPAPRLVRTGGDRAALAPALGLPADALRPDLPLEWVDNGMRTVIIPLRSVEAVNASQPDLVRLAGWTAGEAACVLIFAVGGPGVVCRVFGPDDWMVEDPATGSANGPLGEYLLRHGILAGPVVESEQGAAIGRPSRLRIRPESGSVLVGGRVWLIGAGAMLLRR